MKGTTAVVTGGAGFIGSHLVDRLLADGARVRVLDDFSTGRRENLAHVLDRIELIEGSVTDPSSCAAACAGAQFVFHEAAIPSVQRSVADPMRTHEVGATGTLRMLVAAKEARVRRFVYAGSSSAYGDTPTLPKQEDMAERPLSPYAVAKLTGEHYVRVFAHVYGLQTVVLRYFNVFGPRQDPSSQYSAAIALFITAAAEGRPPTINGDGEQTRDFTYIDNVVEANLLAARTPRERVSGLVFNVGAGERTSVNQLWAMVQTVVGSRVTAVHGPARPGDVRDSLADLTRIRDAMGYEARVGLEEGLRTTARAVMATT
ncbi:MAG: SDR family oxidoreductase [Gemmatimonadetes bacterium]|nr:SDR family oxidoreductase [Gemmatimonadota bacterium]